MQELALANGVKVIVAPSTGKNFTVSATVRVGHVNEPKLGIAAVCEKVLLSQLKNATAVYGGTITSFLVGCSKGDVEGALASLYAILQNPDFSDDRIKAAVNDIVQHTRDMDNARLFTRQMKLLYKHTAFSKGKVLWDYGVYIDSIRSITAEDLKNFMQTYYSGANLVLCLAGPSVEIKKFAQLVKKYFSDYPEGVVQKVENQFYTGGYAYLPAKVDSQGVMLGWDVSQMANVAEANVMMSMLSGRLERGFAGMDVDVEVKIAGYFGMRTLRLYVKTKNEDITKCIKILCDNIVRLITTQASDRRMETSRNRAMCEKLFQLTQIEDAAIEAAWQVLGRGQMYDIPERINATWLVSARNVQEISQEIFSKPLTMVVCANKPTYSYKEVKGIIKKAFSGMKK